MFEFLQALFSPLAKRSDLARLKHELEEAKGAYFVSRFSRDKKVIRALRARVKQLEQELDNAIMGDHNGGTLILIA